MSDISSIKLPDNSSYNVKAKKIFYAECSTARDVAAKVVACSDFVLEMGAVIAVRFTNKGTTNPASGNITLNINGTGAKNIVSKVTNNVYSYNWGWAFYNNQTLLFIYNGTYFVHINQDNNTDTKVTSEGNHYLPVSSVMIPAYEGVLTDITNSSSGTQVVTGVEMDTRGHVTGVTSVALKSTDTKVTVDSALSSTSTNPVQNKVINSALTAIGKTVTDKTNEMFNAISITAPLEETSALSNINATEHSTKYDYSMIRGNGAEVDFPTIIDKYIIYDLADSSNGGLMSADHYTFIEKYNKIRGSSATYTFTSLQDYITLGNCYGNCTNGLVVLSGWFTSTGSAGNPAIISGSFPSAESSFICGIIVNMDSPNTNTRLLVRHESNGTSSLQCGGSITAGKYFFIGVYTAERCAYNLPYTL